MEHLPPRGRNGPAGRRRRRGRGALAPARAGDGGAASSGAGGADGAAGGVGGGAGRRARCAATGRGEHRDGGGGQGSGQRTAKCHGIPRCQVTARRAVSAVRGPAPVAPVSAQGSTTRRSHPSSPSTAAGRSGTVRPAGCRGRARTGGGPGPRRAGRPAAVVVPSALRSCCARFT
ncbi:hypothetical protein EH183_01295 [Streptomyces sp. CB01881]|nr:hypothetical protein C2142_01290 [Streptomyces sp. CB01881]TYC76305.1 hypothetical protein EH183_01295 [Streptomyces sp. CB01881]